MDTLRRAEYEGWAMKSRLRLPALLSLGLVSIMYKIKEKMKQMGCGFLLNAYGKEIGEQAWCHPSRTCLMGEWDMRLILVGCGSLALHWRPGDRP